MSPLNLDLISKIKAKRVKKEFKKIYNDEIQGVILSLSVNYGLSRREIMSYLEKTYQVKPSLGYIDGIITKLSKELNIINAHRKPHPENGWYCFFIKSPTKTPINEKNPKKEGSTVFESKTLPANDEVISSKTLPDEINLDAIIEDEEGAFNSLDKESIEDLLKDSEITPSVALEEDKTSEDAEKKSKENNKAKKKETSSTDVKKKPVTKATKISEKEDTNADNPPSKVEDTNKNDQNKDSKNRGDNSPQENEVDEKLTNNSKNAKKEPVPKKKKIQSPTVEDEPIECEIIGRSEEEIITEIRKDVSSKIRLENRKKLNKVLAERKRIQEIDPKKDVDAEGLRTIWKYSGGERRLVEKTIREAQDKAEEEYLEKKKEID